MAFNGWEKIGLITDNGEHTTGIAPVVVSASRATDIPGFYMPWFTQRLRKGYIRWVNPFSGKPQYVSFKKTRVIVFWSKNPESLLSSFEFFNELGLNYYVHFTLNDYENENLEPGLPSLEKRIGVFKQLAEKIGKERVLWRFDPMILTETISAETILERIGSVGDQIKNYTERLTVSFITNYKKVQRNCASERIPILPVGPKDYGKIGSGLAEFAQRWKIRIATCAEEADLSKFGIGSGKCIDDELMIRLFGNDKALMDFLGVNRIQANLFTASGVTAKNLKDPGQRTLCKCIASKDIGRYNTCPHRCIYCYANYSPQKAVENYKKIDATSDTL